MMKERNPPSQSKVSFDEQNKNHSESQNGFLPNKIPPVLKEIQRYDEEDAGDDIPNLVDSHGSEIIIGVESEEVEEVNDAYNDLKNDLGESVFKLCFKVSTIYSYSQHPRNICSLRG